MRITYDKVSPATGKKSVVIEASQEMDDFLEMDLDTGYQTYTSAFMKTNPQLIQAEKELNRQIVATRITDGDRFWYKLPIIEQNAILYPLIDSLDKEYYCPWCVASLTSCEKEESGLVIPVIEGESKQIVGYMKPDPDTVQVFDTPTQFDDVGDLADSAFLQGLSAWDLLRKSQQQNEQ